MIRYLPAFRERTTVNRARNSGHPRGAHASLAPTEQPFLWNLGGICGYMSIGPKSSPTIEKS